MKTGLADHLSRALGNPSAPWGHVKLALFTILDLLIDATIDWALTKVRVAEKLFAAVTIVIDALH